MLTVDFAGELYELDGKRPFFVGREGDLAIEDNLYLHRRFLEIRHENDLWWLINVGTQLSATVSDRCSSLQAWLAPKGRMPLVFDTTVIRFTAGPTNYEIAVVLSDAPYVHENLAEVELGSTTIGRVSLTPDQRLVLLALAEAPLRRGTPGSADIPSSSSAARRLGWTAKKFEKKIDNVCEKFANHGVRGLKGQQGNLASSRRARLVEYALAARIVTVADLDMLDHHVAAAVAQDAE